MSLVRHIAALTIATVDLHMTVTRALPNSREMRDSLWPSIILAAPLLPDPCSHSGMLTSGWFPPNRRQETILAIASERLRQFYGIDHGRLRAMLDFLAEIRSRQ